MLWFNRAIFGFVCFIFRQPIMLNIAEMANGQTELERPILINAWLERTKCPSELIFKNAPKLQIKWFETKQKKKKIRPFATSNVVHLIIASNNEVEQKYKVIQMSNFHAHFCAAGKFVSKSTLQMNVQTHTQSSYIEKRSHMWVLSGPLSSRRLTAMNIHVHDPL